MACKGLKKGSVHLFRHPKWSRIIFGKTQFSAIFDPFLTHFWPQKKPIFKAFCEFGGAKMTCNGLQMGSFHLFRQPKWSRIIFGKTHFEPIFDPFLIANRPISKAFQDFGYNKTSHHDLKTRQKHLFWHSMWSTIIFEKNCFFFTRWTLLTYLGTHLFGLPRAACRSPLGRSTRV